MRAQQRLLDLYGLRADSRLLDTDGPAPRVHVLDIGSGPPVLFVIGGAYAGAAWAPLVALLPGLRCLLFDRPSFGLTDPVSAPSAATGEIAAAVLGSTLDALGLDRVAVVGNSQGGLWALEFASRLPERVQALVLVGCPAVFLRTSAPLDLRLRVVRWVGPLYQRLRGAPDRPDEREDVDPALREALAELRRAIESMPGSRQARREAIRSVVRLRGARSQARFGAERARRVDVPTLLIWGTEDRNGSPRWGVEAVEAMPDARLQVLRAGHCPWFQRPHATATVLGCFLDEAGVA